MKPMVMEIKREPKDIIKEQLGISYELIEKGDFQKARVLLAKIIEMEPEHNSSYILLGYCAIAEKKWEEANKWYMKGLEFEPESLTLLVLLAESLLMCRNFDNAEKILDRVMAIEPGGLHAEFAWSLLEAANLGVYGEKR